MSSAHPLTIHSMIEGCLRDDPEAWSQFICRFGALARSIIEKHFPSLAGQIERCLADIFRRAHGADNQLFRTYTGTKEREFLMHFANLVLSYCRERASDQESSCSVVDRHALVEALRDLPLLHQEFALVRLKGFSDKEAEEMLRISPETVEGSIQKVRSRLAGGRAPGKGLPLLTQRLLCELEAERGDECPETSTLSRMFDGQISWADKLDVERHLLRCISCLHRWTTMKELIYEYWNLRPLDSRQVLRLREEILTAQEAPTRAPRFVELIRAIRSLLSKLYPFLDA